MATPGIINFLVEWAKRYGQESPDFFKWLTRIGVVLSLITGVPQLLEWLNVTLPVEWEPVVQKVIFFCGLVMSLISMATVKNGAEVVKNPVTDQKTVVVNSALPFTAQREEKKAENDPNTTVIVSTDPPKPAA